MSSAEEPTPKVEFKKKTRKPLRQRKLREDEDSDEDNSLREKLEELKTIQKLRERAAGVKIDGDYSGSKTISEDSTSDPFNIKAGGMVNMSALKNAKLQKANDAYDTGIGTQFNAETNKRDEDEDMVKYIEEHLSKRKHNNKEDSEDAAGNEQGTYCSPEEAALQAVPDHLRQSSTYRSEEMLSNQMLSGIPEVDLGIEAKIKNIEATEEAKLKLLWDRHRKKDGPSQFVPTNMAVNFVQHNRFNIEDADVQKSKQLREQKKIDVPKMTAKEKRKEAEEKATDDFHYERFKKQFRRF
ncbi:telomere length and silencing protein 1 homolog [Belonocnema kinseyi]|uniref:telomere length and silencing protein 1 homolog n=1 Tax=Belonocnema kinseyi TaxID=2817044 RepID=UPI00143D02FD|nr:telomere length and silencing protein 1 homolog [Belonocnema kinseyi]XP_033223522.1 telomere length and silencing protein 1 homolog [Belonocnema kinseyi]